jgi:hypothetical protein
MEAIPLFLFTLPPLFLLLFLLLRGLLLFLQLLSGFHCRQAAASAALGHRVSTCEEHLWDSCVHGRHTQASQIWEIAQRWETCFCPQLVTSIREKLLL